MEAVINENITKKEIEDIQTKMRRKHKNRKRIKSSLRLAVNLVVVLIVLLPLLYALSIAFMPSSEVFTTDLNLIPKNPF